MKITRENIAEHLVRYQLEMVNKTWEDALADQQWYHNITMTQSQFDDFMAYALPLVKKVFRCNKSKAQSIMDWFNLGFGLRIYPLPIELNSKSLKVKIMGAIDFQIKARGKNIKDAYTTAVDNAIDEEGNDPYNGTISTTDGVQDVTEKFKNSGKNMSKFIDEIMEKAEKRSCFAICISQPIVSKNKIKSTVEHIVTPGTKKWVLQYTVSAYGNKLKSYDTKTEAVKKAREYTEENQITTSIIMEKVLIKESPVVAKITYKKDNKERQGEWLFFGVAAY